MWGCAERDQETLVQTMSPIGRFIWALGRNKVRVGKTNTYHHSNLYW